ncbi:MAG TPA: M23 family metallopeptidase [Rickettsiales bacterium]|nr:M23 family metallopeptidase [Rickettsiales bacterium]
MQKKAGVVKAFVQTAKRVFHSRSVIIISEHKVDHIPLSSVMQILLAVGIVGFVSGTSYLTGSYVTARSAIKEKDKKLFSSTMEKSRISMEVNALKRDLVRLDKNGTELDAYTKFLISQHSNVLPEPAELNAASGSIVGGNLFGQNTAQLLDRISFLEMRVNEVKNENLHLVSAIRERTDKKLNYLEDIISMTGLSEDRLERMAEADSKADGKKLRGAALKVNYTPDESAQQEQNKTATGADNEGGPYIPYDETSFNSTEQSLLADVDRLVTLNSIVGALPLARPIQGAHEASPFGKRMDPFNHRWAFHPGLDLAGPSGSRIYSSNDGVVVNAERKPAYGNMIDIEHKFGIVTRYGHLSKILVHPGDHIKKGQLIGIQGSTGRSTGPHLHYEVRVNDRPINPLNFLHAGEYVFQE